MLVLVSYSALPFLHFWRVTFPSSCLAKGLFFSKPLPLHGKTEYFYLWAPHQMPFLGNSMFSFKIEVYFSQTNFLVLYLHLGTDAILKMFWSSVLCDYVWPTQDLCEKWVCSANCLLYPCPHSLCTVIKIPHKVKVQKFIFKQTSTEAQESHLFLMYGVCPKRTAWKK